MQQELRYQVKIHRISEKLNKGIKICIFPFFLWKKNSKRKQQKHANNEKEIHLVQACK
jgi:hypothetical protein